MGQLIRCIACDEVFLRSPWDQFPEYEKDEASPEGFQLTERDDFREFLEGHRGHRLEELTIIDDSFVSDRPYTEPVKTAYFKATNGRERFVIKRYRKKIGESHRYELIHGDYSVPCVSVQIQSRAIARQLEIEFPGPLKRDKIRAFVNVFEQVARNIDIFQCERVPEESPHPLEVDYRMDDMSLMFLLRNCRRIFDRNEFPHIESFIDRHKDEGVLLLRAIHSIQIAETPKESVEPSSELSASTASEKRKKSENL